MAVGLARTREQLLEIALVNYLWPALTVVTSLPLLKQRATWWLAPGTALALSGVFLVMAPEGRVSWRSFLEHAQSNPAAYALALTAAVTWALYSNLTRRFSTPEKGGAVELFIPVSGLTLLALRMVIPESGTWTTRAGLEAGALAGITAIAYVLWDLAMRRGDVILVAACSYFTPLLSTGVSCLYLGVLPGRTLWIGCGLLVGGSLVTWRSVPGWSRNLHRTDTDDSPSLPRTATDPYR
jgi:drug/metabolite transporter (DMT)-like permease